MMREKPLLEHVLELGNVVLGHDRDGDIDDRLNGLALLQLDQCFDGGLAFAGRILLNEPR